MIIQQYVTCPRGSHVRPRLYPSRKTINAGRKREATPSISSNFGAEKEDVLRKQTTTKEAKEHNQKKYVVHYSSQNSSKELLYKGYSSS